MWSTVLPVLGTITSGLIASTIGGIIAIRAIWTNRAIARLRATLDTIERTESQEHYKRLTSVFKEFRQSPSMEQTIEEILQPRTDKHRERRTEILFFLNHYELIAVGFRTGVLDKGFYAEFMRGAVVRDWRAARSLIEGMRIDNEAQNPVPRQIYEHFEELAKEWEWEILQEEHLRRHGFGREQIKKSLQWFRERPKHPRPPR
jgi:hypothetical protein